MILDEALGYDNKSAIISEAKFAIYETMANMVLFKKAFNTFEIHFLRYPDTLGHLE